MGRLFGTDGVRGIANEKLTCELAMQIGRAAASVLSRGGRAYLFAARGLENVEQAPGLTVLRMPVQAGNGAVFAAAVCLQLLAYETAKRLGLPIDTPRNLAKSVTVA